MAADLLFRFKMKLLAIILIFYIANSFAIEIKAAVPSFLVPTESIVSSASSNSLVDSKPSSTSKSWYCNTKDSDNVFCGNNNPKTSSIEYESSSNQQLNGDNRGELVDASQNTDSNQKTLQDQELRNAMEKYQGGLSLPIAPTDDVKMNINQQQLQFNIKY